MYKRKGTSGTRKRPDSYLCKKYSNEGAIKDIRPDYGCKPFRTWGQGCTYNRRVFQR